MYNPSEARDARGRWSSSGSKNPHEMTGHNGHSQTTGLAGAALRGARESAASSAKMGAAYGAILGGAFGGPVGAATGALASGIGGAVSGAVVGAVGGASLKHDQNLRQLKRDATARGVKYETFWDTRGGAATKFAILGGGIAAGIAGGIATSIGVQSGVRAGVHAFYGRAGGAGGFSSRPGGPRPGDGSGPRSSYAKAGVEREKARVAARMADKMRQDPTARKITALRAKAADTSVTSAERAAFAAKAAELTSKHRRG